ncbi:ribonuclease H-like domain-containing protein [Tanacetum coccineum]|uniref:Ribonuclease H-like domain-containing protein n=1 Tax=Tanacetum coccineum TaxID=301880 RepID=A0ABQ5GRV8_9ASTR
MIAIRMKKFYKKTRRRVHVDGKAHVGFDKKKLECFNCHNTGHFARECTTKGTHDGKKKRDSFYQHQEAGKQEKNQMGLLTMDDGIVNWGEHTEDEETNHALMAISSSSEVSLCSKTCIDSYNTIKTLCDEQMNQLGDQEAQILAYSQAVKKLEAQLVTFQKQQLSLNEKLTFQANEIYEKDEKLKKYRRIGMKAVKEKEQLQKTLDSWKDSSKNLWRLINSGMSSSSKIGLGYEIKSNNEVLSYEEEMNFSVFNSTEVDSVGKPLYSRFIKTNDFKGVPHPLSGDYTPKPQEEIDESFAGSIGTSSEHSVDLESEISRVPQEVIIHSKEHARIEILIVCLLSIVDPSAGQEAPSVTQPQPSSTVLRETKQTFRKAILTLVDRVKTLEVALKRKTKRVLLSDSEEEETEAQGRKTHDLDLMVSLKLAASYQKFISQVSGQRKDIQEKGRVQKHLLSVEDGVLVWTITRGELWRGSGWGAVGCIWRLKRIRNFDWGSACLLCCGGEEFEGERVFKNSGDVGGRRGVGGENGKHDDRKIFWD